MTYVFVDVIRRKSDSLTRDREFQASKLSFFQIRRFFQSDFKKIRIQFFFTVERNQRSFIKREIRLL